MSRFKELARAVYESKYHLVWCPKYRYRILQGEVGKGVREIIRELCAWRRIEILAENVREDHVHLVVEFPPKYSVSKRGWICEREECDQAL